MFSYIFIFKCTISCCFCIGTVSVLYRYCIGAAVGIVSVLYRYCIGIVSVPYRYRYCIGTVSVPVLYRYCTGTVKYCILLGFHWNLRTLSTGTVPVLCDATAGGGIRI